MSVFGVDCGKNRVHIVGESSSFATEQKSGTDRATALSEMREEILGFMAAQGFYDSWENARGGDVRLYIEAAIVAGRRNLQATIGIAETVGMVLSLGYPATLVPVATWKKAVIGDGGATKEDVEAWYRGTGGTLKGQDFYDAAAICAYGVQDMEVAQRLRSGLLSSAGGEEVPQRGQSLARLARASKLRRES